MNEENTLKLKIIYFYLSLVFEVGIAMDAYEGIDGTGIMTLETFRSMYTFGEISRLDDHFKRMVVGANGVSYVDNENDIYYAEMVELALKQVVGKSAAQHLLVTGSASQNLKCVSEEQQGDADILFISSFPKLTKEDQEKILVPCDEPGFFSIKQLEARQYPFVKRNGIRLLNANSLRDFESVWFAKDLQLALILIESFDHEYERAGRDKVASSLDWRTSFPMVNSMSKNLLHKNGHYFHVFVRSYRENILPILHENAKKHAETVLELLLGILSFSGKYGSGQTKLAIEELIKISPHFENGVVPAFLRFLRDRDSADTLEIEEDITWYARAHEYFENIAAKETGDGDTASFDETRIRGSFDLVPGIECDGFPLIAKEWKKRVERKSWPHPQTVTLVVSSGFHLVPKVSKSSGSDSSTSFRLAFNTAENLLAQSVTRFQRECFRVFKMYYYEKLKLEPKVLTTYHLKTVFFWVLEKTDGSIWKEENRAYCCMLLLQYLKVSLMKETLTHYFIPENNLFKYLEKRELKKVLKAVEDIMADPISTSGKAIEQIKSFYASVPNRQPDLEDVDLVNRFFIKSNKLFETAMEELRDSRLEDDDMQIRFLLFLTNEAKIKVLKFFFDIVLARNFQAKIHGLFSKFAPLPSPLASFLHIMLPVSNEITTHVLLPKAHVENRVKFQTIEGILETAKHLTYEDLLNFAMLKNAFSSKSESKKFDMIANVLSHLVTKHEEL